MRKFVSYTFPILIIVALVAFILYTKISEPEKKQIAELMDTIVQKQDLSFDKPIRVKPISTGSEDEDTIKVCIENIEYTIYPYGKIELKNTKSNQMDSIQLKTELIVKAVCLYKYRDFLIVYYVDNDGGLAASYIECYDFKTLKLKWKNTIDGFNLTTPLVVDSFTYMATVGFIGKLNLNNGKYLWKQDNLYELTRFDFFSSITREGENVCFTKDSVKRLYNVYGKVIVDDKTGKIKKIVKNQSK